MASRGVYYVVLDGKTPYERGYQHGVALDFPIVKALRQFMHWIRDVVGLEEPEANHALLEGAPKTFEMTSEMGDGSYGFTMERLELGLKTLSADPAGITLESFQGIFRTRPILVYPGKPTGRTLMQMTAEIPAEGSPVLYLTPDSPNVFAHARFTFQTSPPLPLEPGRR
jgi:hypothetical protein